MNSVLLWYKPTEVFQKKVGAKMQIFSFFPGALQLEQHLERYLELQDESNELSLIKIGDRLFPKLKKITWSFGDITLNR